MPARTQAGGTSRTRFMQAVSKELTSLSAASGSFERRTATNGQKDYRCRSKNTTPKIGA